MVDGDSMAGLERGKPDSVEISRAAVPSFCCNRTQQPTTQGEALCEAEVRKSTEALRSCGSASVIWRRKGLMLTEESSVPLEGSFSFTHALIVVFFCSPAMAAVGEYFGQTDGQNRPHGFGVRLLNNKVVVEITYQEVAGQTIEVCSGQCGQWENGQLLNPGRVWRGHLPEDAPIRKLYHNLCLYCCSCDGIYFPTHALFFFC